MGMFLVFNGDSDDQDLCTLADNLVKTDDTDFPLKQKAMFANLRLREILSWILSVYGGWIFDDANRTSTYPASTTTLNANQTIYGLPLDMIDLHGVSVIDQNGTSWHKLKPITLEQIKDRGYAEPDFMTTAGVPEYYRPVGNAIKIYPAASYTTAAGIEIEIGGKDISPFTSTSTNAYPGIPTAMHESVGVGMALSFAKINSLDNVVDLQREWDGNEEVTKVEGGWKKRIKSHFQSRFREAFPQNIKQKVDVIGDYIS